MSKDAKKENIKNLLAKLSKRELLSIILELANRDCCISESLRIRYEKEKDPAESTRNIIVRSIEDQPMNYYDARHAVDGVERVLIEAAAKINSGDIINAVKMYIVVLEEMVECLKYYDDSKGYIGSMIDKALEQIHIAVCKRQLEKSDRKKMFDVIFDHAKNRLYNDWITWRIGLLSAMIPLCKDSNIRGEMECYFAELESSESESWNYFYLRNNLQRLQYDIILKFDGKDLATKYLEQHLENSDFRRIAIDNAISEEQYEIAHRLCLDGEKINHEHLDLIMEWKNLRYSIYERTNNVEAQKKLGADLLLNGEFKYYDLIKALYKKEEWGATLEKILKKIAVKGPHDVYVQILITEKLKRQLLEYCQKNIYSITSYYKHLLPEYKDDVGEIFMAIISKESKNSGDRKHYKKIVDVLRQYKEACGEDAAYAFRDKIAETYPKRTSFIDELKKL